MRVCKISMERYFFLKPLAARHLVSITGDSSARRRRAKLLALASQCPRLDRNEFLQNGIRWEDHTLTIDRKSSDKLYDIHFVRKTLIELLLSSAFRKVAYVDYASLIDLCMRLRMCTSGTSAFRAHFNLL